MVGEIMSSMPELAQSTDQSAVMDAIRQGAYSGIGRTDINTLRNPAFDATGGSGVSAVDRLTNSGFVNAPSDAYSSYFDEHRNLIAQQVAEKHGIEGVETFDDLLTKGRKERRKNIKESTVLGQENLGAMVGRQKLMEGLGKEDYDAFIDSEFKSSYKDAIKEARESVKNIAADLAMPMFDINEIYSARNKDMTEVNKNIDQLNSWVSSRQDTLRGFDKKGQRELDAITKELDIKGMAFDGRTFILSLKGKDDDDDTHEVQVYIDPNAQYAVRDMAMFVGQQSPKFRALIQEQVAALQQLSNPQ
jgi:hypothetical protein